MDELIKSLEASLPAINGMGVMLFDPVWATKMHPAAESELLHVIDGKLLCETESGRFAASAGDTLILPLKCMHKDIFDPEQGLKLFYCNFTWPNPGDFFEVARPGMYLGLPQAAKTEISQVIEHLVIGLGGAGQDDEILARARLQTILLIGWRAARGQGGKTQASSAREKMGAKRHRDLFQEARNYIERHFAEIINLDSLAEELGVSGYHLSHVFSEQSEFSLFEYITAIRMKHAQAMLSAGGMNVAQVARKAGYDDPNYFAKAFRKFTGKSPSEFAAASTKHLQRR